MLPTKGWKTYEEILRQIGERRFSGGVDDVAFLQVLGFVDQSDWSLLTAAGQQYFEAVFVFGNQEKATLVLSDALARHPVAARLLETFWSTGEVKKTSAVSALRSWGFSLGANERNVASLLGVMNRAGLVVYSSSKASFEVLAHPDSAVVMPNSVLLSRRTPFGNKLALRRILEGCTEYICWLDKHFMPAVFEVIYDAVQEYKVRTLQVVSLQLPDNSNRKALREYGELYRDLAYRGVNFEWRYIDQEVVRDLHDRWIISSNVAYNVPDTNSIISGQRSEILRTDQRIVLKQMFDGYWERGTPVLRSGHADRRRMA